jgi:hypothetical protein
MSEYDRQRVIFEGIAEVGPVTTAELHAALFIAAHEYEAESYDATPFWRLVQRLDLEGVAS